VEISSSGADALEKLEHSDVAGITVTNLADSAADINFTWQLYQNGAGMISQVASASSPSSANQDGLEQGRGRASPSGSDGLIEGTFSNGKTRDLRPTGSGQLCQYTRPDANGRK
jgi:flagellar hook protein FlgE